MHEVHCVLHWMCCGGRPLLACGLQEGWQDMTRMVRKEDCKMKHRCTLPLACGAWEQV